MTISTLLVANRGEIALRVMKTARDLGLRTVAVYSDADANAPHVKFADDAIHIGPSPVGESYLKIDTIIDAAKTAGADAIHPGYGFLSENAAFAEACKKADIIFVGPPVGAIDVMGDKAKSKRAMIAAGVPCIPGYQGEDQSDATLIKESKSVGFPLMVKAAAGGGGRGMRLVHKESDLANAIKLARSEAENAFGSGELIIERAVIKPRHVEVQVFADEDGNTIHLGERDCSVQRRHQKVIEEAPCPVMTENLRARMGHAAVEAAKAVNYVGAGTVEFLLDPSGDFFFLEMNTRLQVEHPVTECVTGLDLVALQLRVADGEPLGLSQDDISLTGHAIEVRLYAEDPDNDFLPSTGNVDLWHPASGPGIRVDAGLSDEVSPFYDSMVAKVIAYGPTRDDARRRLVKALSETALIGPKNNRDFLIDALQQAQFVSGEATTAFIGETYGETGYENAAPSMTDYALAAIIHFKLGQKSALANALPVPNELVGWNSLGAAQTRMIYTTGHDENVLIDVSSDGTDSYTVIIGEDTINVRLKAFAPNRAEFSISGLGIDVLYAVPSAHALGLVTPTLSFSVTNIAAGLSALEEAGGGGTVIAPMHGQLLDILVTEGQRVEKGQTLAILEAMKMQHEIEAEISGTITTIAASPNSQIAADDLIFEIEADEDADEG